MSTEAERIFSGSKLTISDQRSRLGDDIIEALECLKSWAHEEVILGLGRKLDRWRRCWKIWRNVHWILAIGVVGLGILRFLFNVWSLSAYK